MKNHNPNIIDGEKISSERIESLHQRIDLLKKETGQAPGLCAIMIGDNLSSLSFIKIKERIAKKIGVYFERKHFPANFSPTKVIDFIRQKNADSKIHGIVLQLPLPSEFKKIQLLKSIHPFKDVDCLHPKNLGLLAYGQPAFLPPVVKTVKLILKTLKISLNELQKSEVVLVGGGILVGKPLALWLMNQTITTSICQKNTQNLKSFTQKADLVISGTGVSRLIKADMVKRNTVIIDFGYSKDDTNQIMGDADYQEISKKARVTPTPHGTGPIIVVCVLENVIDSFEKAIKR